MLFFSHTIFRRNKVEVFHSGSVDHKIKNLTTCAVNVHQAQTLFFSPSLLRIWNPTCWSSHLALGPKGSRVMCGKPDQEPEEDELEEGEIREDPQGYDFRPFTIPSFGGKTGDAGNSAESASTRKWTKTSRERSTTTAAKGSCSSSAKRTSSDRPSHRETKRPRSRSPSSSPQPRPQSDKAPRVRSSINHSGGNVTINFTNNNVYLPPKGISRGSLQRGSPEGKQRKINRANVWLDKLFMMFKNNNVQGYFSEQPLHVFKRTKEVDDAFALVVEGVASGALSYKLSNLNFVFLPNKCSLFELCAAVMEVTLRIYHVVNLGIALDLGHRLRLSLMCKFLTKCNVSMIQVAEEHGVEIVSNVLTRINNEFRA